RHLSAVMAGLGPAIHVFLVTKKERRGCPAAQTSLRSLRKLDCVAGHDESTALMRDRDRAAVLIFDLVYVPGAAGRAAAQRLDREADLVAGFERLARPSIPAQRGRASRLEIPDRGAPVLILHPQQDETVRTGELEFLHGAFELDRVVL